MATYMETSTMPPMKSIKDKATFYAVDFKNKILIAFVGETKVNITGYVIEYNKPKYVYSIKKEVLNKRIEGRQIDYTLDYDKAVKMLSSIPK